MKLLGIHVAGKLPSMCFMCPLSARKDGVAICSVKYQFRGEKNHHKYQVNVTDSPPSWCPLVQESEEE